MQKSLTDGSVISAAVSSALDRAGFVPVAHLDPPPILCERCKASVPFTGKRCRMCESAWRRWFEGSRRRMREGLAREAAKERERGEQPGDQRSERDGRGDDGPDGQRDP